MYSKEEKLAFLKKVICVLIIFLFVIPMLTAILSIKFPLTDYIKQNKKKWNGYMGTTESYFYTADPEQAQKDFEEIAYYFLNYDWEKDIKPIIQTATNPGEAARVLEEELHLDLSEIYDKIEKIYNNLDENQ